MTVQQKLIYSPQSWIIRKSNSWPLIWKEPKCPLILLDYAWHLLSSVILKRSTYSIWGSESNIKTHKRHLVKTTASPKILPPRKDLIFSSPPQVKTSELWGAEISVEWRSCSFQRLHKYFVHRAANFSELCSFSTACQNIRSHPQCNLCLKSERGSCQCEKGWLWLDSKKPIYKVEVGGWN